MLQLKLIIASSFGVFVPIWVVYNACISINHCAKPPMQCRCTDSKVILIDSQTSASTAPDDLILSNNKTTLTQMDAVYSFARQTKKIKIL